MNDIDRIDHLNDYAFKYIFGSTDSADVTMSFLNGVLGLEGDRAIAALEFADRETVPRALDDKVSRLDVLVTTGRGEVINIEVQVANRGTMEKRTLYYWARLYGSQLKSGESFGSLRKTITINVLGFGLYPGPQWHWKYVLSDANSGRAMDDVLEIHFVEVPKFRSQDGRGLSPLERWVMFLANVEGEVMDRIAESDPAIQKAIDMTELLKQNELARLLYLRRHMAIHEAITDREVSLEEGLERGRVEGRVDAILDVVEGRFGEVPEAMRLSLASIGDPAALAQVSRAIGRADSLEAVERAIAAGLQALSG